MKNPFKNIKFDKKDVEFVKKPVIYTIFHGLCINYIFHFVFYLPFTILTFLAYGLAYMYIKNDILKLIKGFIYKT